MPPQQPLEFDHAINYVTKIKRRFQNEPDKYKSFLEILDTYQKQQRSIKEVLDQVSMLFRNHADLLEDFTYFLPDAVQPQAKERLARAAARSHRQPTRRPSRREMDVDTGVDAAPAARATRSRRRAEAESVLDLTPSERSFFERMKNACGSQEQWSELLKCLDLYSMGVFMRSELLAAVRDVLGDSNRHLVEELRVFITRRGTVVTEPEDTFHSLPVAEIDFSACRRCTPSYRELPPGVPIAPCTERGALERDVLNDRWVSVPTGSEDFSFKHMRRNQYEEALFRCEDERYGVDMTIENNASAIRALQPLAEEIDALRASESEFQWQFRLDRRSLGVLHLKAIARVYGGYGKAMLELLRKNPAGAIPVILRRLKQKDAEWRRARLELHKAWKGVQEKNYPKSLDHRSFYWKAADKKAVNVKVILGEVRNAVSAAEGEVKEATEALEQAQAELEQAQGKGGAAAASAVKGLKEGVEAARARLSAAEAVVPELVFPFRHPDVHADVVGVVSYAMEKAHPGTSKVDLADVWSNFLFRFLEVDPSQLQARGREHLSALQAHVKDGHSVVRIGTPVRTPYGNGIVESVRPNPHTSEGIVYDVALPWGNAKLVHTDVAPAGDVSGAGDDVDMAGSSSSSSGLPTVGRARPLVLSELAKRPPASVKDVSGLPPVPELVPGLHPRRRAYLTSTGYAFLRLYAMLYDRLAQAQAMCVGAAAEGDATEHAELAAELQKMDPALAGLMGPTGSSASPVGGASGLYQLFLTALYFVIDGTMENGQFEDECRRLMGTGAYLLFTLDKLTHSAAKQLAAMVGDAAGAKARSLYEYQAARLSAAEASTLGSTSSSVAGTHMALSAVQSYHANIASVFTSRHEDCYCVDHLPQGAPGAGSNGALRVRLVGKPEFDEATATLNAAVRTLPAELQQMTGMGTEAGDARPGVLHATRADAVTTSKAAATTAAAHAAADAAAVPFVPPASGRHSDAVSSADVGVAGGAVPRSLARDGAAVQPVVGDVTMALDGDGSLTATGGSDVLVSNPTAGGPREGVPEGAASSSTRSGRLQKEKGPQPGPQS
jgi:paired amphipathic helix protein Sin3a